MSVWLPIGLVGLGLWLIHGALTHTAAPGPRRPARTLRRLRHWLIQADLERVTPVLFLATCLLGAALGGVAAHVAYGFPVLDLLGVLLGASAYPLWVRGRHARRRQLVRRAMPDAIDRMRAGLASEQTPEQAVARLGTSGPEELQPYFQVLRADLAAGGDFASAVERLAARLGDGAFDEVADALVLHQAVGGPRLGVCLGQLAAAQRTDLALRDRIMAARAKTLLSAKVVLALPIALLLLMRWWQPATAQTMNTVLGQEILGGCAIVVVGGYLAVRWLGRLPAEDRVLVR